MTEQRCTLCGIIYTPDDEDDRICQCCKDDMNGNKPDRGYEIV